LNKSFGQIAFGSELQASFNGHPDVQYLHTFSRFDVAMSSKRKKEKKNGAATRRSHFGDVQNPTS